MKQGEQSTVLKNISCFNDLLIRDRMPWFDPRLSFNPAVHRIKQALFHAAIVTDLRTNPLPEPHPEVIKYLNPPKRVLKRANGPIEEAIGIFKVKQGILNFI